MCGITGFINLNGEPASPVILKKMTDAIAHRGPDGEGQWVEDNVGIGHRRLAIIDPSPAGHQPMISIDHRYVLSYNGEIYNYRELRTDLEAEGVWFHSNTDSEVVLYALAKWGADALLKFNGMFALALWDRKEKTLILARDRFGIKPLYYATQNNTFAFGSEQKSIDCLPSVNKQANYGALLEYFTFQNIFTDQTLLQDFKLLPAGHFLEIKAKTGTLRSQKYWDYLFREPELVVDKREYIEELDRLFVQAVNRQLVADVELGSYLSGGMDSGSITALASRQMSNLKTFTVGFDLSSATGIELGFDEREIAEAMSASFQTEQYEMVLKSGDMERCLAQLVWHLEEPRVGQSYPNYYAAKLASKFVKVVLAGSGGDELFGGYPWRYFRTSRTLHFEDYIDHYYLYWQRLANNTELGRLFAPVRQKVDGIWTRDIFRDVFLTHENALETPEDYINHSLYFEAKTFLHGLLVVEDKLSMAHGLENRVPFLDNDLVDFAMRCPVELKLKNLKNTIRIDENIVGDKQNIHFYKTNDGKQILRETMASYIPSGVTKAEKKGFSSPDATWFKGESAQLIKRKLLDGDGPIFSVLDKTTISKLVNEHLDGKRNRRLLIWSLLYVNFWLDQNF